MSTTADRRRVEHAQAPRTRMHRAMSLRSRAIMLGAQVGIRSLVTAWMAAPDFPWPTRAIDDVARCLPRPRHTHLGGVALRHCRAEWVRAERCGTRRAILYLHGGAFLTCGLNTHRPLVSRLSRSSDAP